MGQKQTMRFTQLMPHITPHRQTLLFAVLLLTGTSLLSLANPWMAGLVTAEIMGESILGIGTLPLLGFWLGLMIVSGVLSFMSTYYVGATGERLTAQLRTRLYQHLQALPVGYYHDRSRGETLSLLSTDAAIISNFVTATLVQILPSSLTFLGAFVMMAWLDTRIALVAALLLPLYMVAIKLVGRQLRPLSRAWVHANSKLVSVVDENLLMLPAIKAFTREAREQKRFDEVNSELLSISRRQLRIDAMLGPAIGLLGGIGLLGLLWMGNVRIQAGTLDPHELVSLLLYALLLVSPLRILADVYGQIQRTLGSAERIQVFLAQQPEPAHEGASVLNTVRGHISFRNVSFNYPGKPSVLRNFNLEIAAGETVAITGRNGVGKSTLAYLLMRFADPTDGQISIDGVDISDLTLDNLRKQIGLVSQRVMLLNGTVAENIAYGCFEPRMEDIEWAARAAHAHDFIRELPRGYDTLIGDQGVRLSGGQQQRISLARTLMAKPPILVLDEATAMFDPEGEEALIAECRTLLQTRTVILITHRPASLALAGRVVKMEGA